MSAVTAVNVAITCKPVSEPATLPMERQRKNKVLNQIDATITKPLYPQMLANVAGPIRSTRFQE